MYTYTLRLRYFPLGTSKNLFQVSHDATFPNRFNYGALKRPMRRRYCIAFFPKTASRKDRQRYASLIPTSLRRLARLRRKFDVAHNVTLQYRLTRTKQVIYALYNMVNGRIYVGLTQRTAFVRFTEHLYSAGALARQQRAGINPTTQR